MTTASDVDKAYDWDHYEDEWFPSAAYTAQEEQLTRIFYSFLGAEAYRSIADPPRPAQERPRWPESVLEVGPGLGRITKLAVEAFPSPPAKFALMDISEAALEKTSLALPQVDFAYAVGRVEDEYGPLGAGVETAFPLAPHGFDLVLAIEVLMHVPPTEAPRAVGNLLSVLMPKGLLITCDWTKPLLNPNAPIRTQNYRHGYELLFARWPVRVLKSVNVGLQTIFVVQRA